MTLEEQYKELHKSRKTLPLDIIVTKKRMAWEYFRNIVPVTNLEKNIAKNFTLYFAPVKKIRGARMVCWPVGYGDKEIYIDENYCLTHPDIAKMQITHEVLHGLSQSNGGGQSFFGHKYYGNVEPIYIGIDEACTQLFTEDIEGTRLGADVDYLYFVKSIMRVMKVIFGVKNLANQYLNNNTDFEIVFDNFTDGKFYTFARFVNEIYNLDKAKHSGKISNEEAMTLNIKKQQVISFTKSLVAKCLETNPNIVNELNDEVNDNIFLNKICVNPTNYQIVGGDLMRR